MDAAAIEKFLQYTHLEKLYGYLPGMSDALPAIFGMDEARYAALTATFAVRAREAAEALRADDRVAALVAALPFKTGQTVLAVGDSMTDDLQGWAEILRHLLDVARPDDRIRVVNAGLSAHTSAMVLRRWPATLTPAPDWILCALGGNDVTRVGGDRGKPQVGLDESVSNLQAMRSIAAARTDASWVWFTPAPVDEERVAGFAPFRFGESTWRNTDVEALAAAVREFDEPVVDLVAAFGIPPAPHLQGDDGVHPTLDGQATIVSALLDRLAAP